MSVLVGKPAPDFTATAVMGDNTIAAGFNLKTHIKYKYAVLFFYPLDFTFVCPSEILAFDHRLPGLGVGHGSAAGAGRDRPCPRRRAS